MEDQKINILIPENLAILEPDDKLLDIIDAKEFNDEVLFQVESGFHDISVVENEIGRFLHYGETYQAGFIKTDFYKGNLPYINYFLIPYLLKQNVKSILLIGMGTGKIIKDFEFLYDGLERIDVVDIEENIVSIASEYFGFDPSDKFNFYLQDGRIFLRESKKKYDLIVVDVANNEGIDGRFLENSYFEEIKKCLKKGGIFVSNLCASPQFEHPKNSFIREIVAKYLSFFKNLEIFKGDYSDKVYYKSFFGLDQRVIDTTNVILIASDSPLFSPKPSAAGKSAEKKVAELGIDINLYLADRIKNISL